MATDSVPSNQSFGIHLRSLQTFGQELQTQLDGLRQPLDQLAQLLPRELPLGSFGEAYSLAAHHLSLAGQMYSLLQAVRQAVEFSGQVTGQVVAGYQQYDEQAAAALAGPGTPTGTAGGATAPGDGPTDPPVAVRISLSQPASVQVTGASLPVTVAAPFTYSDPANAHLSGV